MSLWPKEFQLLLLVILMVQSTITRAQLPNIFKSPNRTDIQVEPNHPAIASVLACAPHDENIPYDVHYNLTIDGMLSENQAVTIDYNLPLSHQNTKGEGYLIIIYNSTSGDEHCLEIAIRVLNHDDISYSLLKITVNIINKISGDPLASEEFTFHMVEHNLTTTNASNVDAAVKPCVSQAVPIGMGVAMALLAIAVVILLVIAARLACCLWSKNLKIDRCC